MFIENVSIPHLEKGFHYEAGVNSMLIQIVDVGYHFPKPLKSFKEVHQFQFNDVEYETSKGKITKEQAVQIVELLQHAYEKRMNVIVHCHAGLCRSGAVVEVGVMMGFQDPEKVRLPNVLIKKALMRELGWSYE